MEEYREQINTIDQQLITLLEKRVDISKKIGNYKCKHNISYLSTRYRNKYYRKVSSFIIWIKLNSR